MAKKVVVVVAVVVIMMMTVAVGLIYYEHRELQMMKMCWFVVYLSSNSAFS
jgi:uncharacterized membrane protein